MKKIIFTKFMFETVKVDSNYTEFFTLVNEQPTNII